MKCGVASDDYPVMRLGIHVKSVALSLPQWISHNRAYVLVLHFQIRPKSWPVQAKFGKWRTEAHKLTSWANTLGRIVEHESVDIQDVVRG